MNISRDCNSARDSRRVIELAADTAWVSIKHGGMGHSCFCSVAGELFSLQKLQSSCTYS